MAVDVETKFAVVLGAITIRLLRARRILSDEDAHEILATVAQVLPERENPDIDAVSDIAEKIIFSSLDDGPGEPAIV